jgi:hypothetical protein
MGDLSKVITGNIPRLVNNIRNRATTTGRMNPNLARFDIRERFFLYNEMRSKTFP